MTVQSDPGNDANSYSDAAARAWKTTAGLWKTDANDTVGQNGDSLGNQLWRTTANTWHTRANTAYDSGVWGTGSTWQARYNSEVTLYNNEVTAYNNALAPASVDHLSASAAIPNGSDGFSGGNLASITADRTGQWVIIGRADVHGPASGVDLYQGGTRIAGAGNYFWHLDASGAVVGSPQAGVFWQGALNNGDVISVRAATASSGSGSAYIDAYFIPTQANPH